MELREFYVELGSYCKNFRKNVLNLTLEDVAKDVSIKTLSSFEHGRSTNFLHSVKYVEACPTDALKEQFIKGVNEITNRVMHNE